MIKEIEASIEAAKEKEKHSVHYVGAAYFRGYIDALYETLRLLKGE